MLVLILFAIAIMDGVRDLIVARPQQVLGYALCALFASLLLQALGFLAFGWLPRIAALTVGLIAGNNNMAGGGGHPRSARTPGPALFFAAAQPPDHVAPAGPRPGFGRVGAARARPG